MNNQELREKILKSNLPKCVIKHLVSCIDNESCHKWHCAMDTHFDGVISSVNSIVDKACITTGRDKESLFRETDFDPKDLDPDRLDAAFAEIRVINYLSNEGFQNINLLRAQTGTLTADIVAHFGKNLYAIDVACASAGTLRNIDDLVAYMIGIYNVKKTQFYNCTRSGLVFVINSYPALAFGYQPLFLKAVQKAHLEICTNNSFHIGVVTGRVAWVEGGNETFSGPDDVVHPTWR